jgi:23S rRNA (guanine2445-N2)-methyltransferase / 23S rRNA (guanine2069-N7)-methyltransferase
MTTSALFITCPKGIEGLLLDELKSIGVESSKETIGGVYCRASLEVAYKICLWSRLANRVYLPLLRAEVTTTRDCYDACVAIKWETILKDNATVAVDFKGASEFMRNTMFGAQLIKDTVVDRIQKTRGHRTQVEPKSPDCLIHVRLHHNELTVFYDLSGHSLHQRGYRREAGEAPIKENLAAALLIRAGWPKVMSAPLIDPFCGSGTLLIEAAMMASDKAPGLDRLDYGFLNWQGHDETLWSTLQREALERHEKAMEGPLPLIFGFDKDPAVLKTAKANIRAAGFTENIQLEAQSIRDFALPEACTGLRGLIVANPPYGERLGVSDELIPVYAELGSALKQSRWPSAILTSDPTLARATGLWSYKQYALINGKIPCKLYLFEIKD